MTKNTFRERIQKHIQKDLEKALGLKTKLNWQETN